MPRRIGLYKYMRISARLTGTLGGCRGIKSHHWEIFLNANIVRSPDAVHTPFCLNSALGVLSALSADAKSRGLNSSGDGLCLEAIDQRAIRLVGQRTEYICTYISQGRTHAQSPQNLVYDIVQDLLHSYTKSISTVKNI
ncbi:hypothetical protein Bbelb_143570 [Branchiostoma belcheri]|nr:hypothetical protein Bbelb_143570 [Branchiostoma belcheri]